MVRIIRAVEKNRDVMWIITPCIALGGCHRLEDSAAPVFRVQVPF
jgi:hypothetical protein